LLFDLFEKTDPHIGVLAGFLGFIWVIVSGKTFGCGPLAGIGRGANQLYFGKKSYN